MQIAVLDDYANVAMQVADWAAVSDDEVTVFNDSLLDHQALVARLLPFDVICIMRERTPFAAKLLNALPNLKLLVTSGPRNLSIDLAAATENGVTVCGTESRKTSTSELAILLILSLSRNLIPELRAMNESGWQTGLGRDLQGLSLGLIGLGKIGQQMATIGKVFGMQINAWSPNLTADKCDPLGVKFQPDLASLMAQSDIVSVHMVLSERSERLVDANAFAAMRDKAIFINTSRGPIADEKALIEGLKKGKPWKAGIDVFAQEPLPLNHPMRDKTAIDSGRLLLSPHLGYVTERTWQLFYQQTVDAIVAWKKGQAIRVLN